MVIACYNPPSKQRGGLQPVNVPQLKALRQRGFLSQQELSEKSGISVATVQRLEAGRGGAHLRTIRRLAEALGVKPEELVKASEGKYE